MIPSFNINFDPFSHSVHIDIDILGILGILDLHASP